MLVGKVSVVSDGRIPLGGNIACFFATQIWKLHIVLREMGLS